MSSKVQIEVQNICFSYPSINALKDVSVAFNSKEFTCIIGPNGSGKTTFLRCLARVLIPQKGAIYLDGKSLKLYGRKELAKIISYLPAENPSSINLTVAEFLMAGRYPHSSSLWETKKDLIICDKIVKALNLSDLLDRPVTELSNGEKQRVLLARALIQEPKILLADEPTTHLDIKYQIEIMRTLKKLAKEDKLSVVASIHDLNLALAYADRLVVMKSGKILAVANPTSADLKYIIEKAYEVRINLVKLGSRYMIAVQD